MSEKQINTLSVDRQDRKDQPMCSGVLDYFPDAIAMIARVSKIGNDQHNPGQPLHWSRGKSTDHADCLLRHLVDRGKMDVDGVTHSAKMAWRALALLQEELEEQRMTGTNLTKQEVASRGSRYEPTQEDLDKLPKVGELVTPQNLVTVFEFKQEFGFIPEHLNQGIMT